MRTFIILGGLAAALTTAGPGYAADPTTAQGADTWRASKLIGVTIYGPGTVSVGKIDDLVLGHDGKISTIVVGVGGFLGLGEKDVGIPFEKVTFTNQPIAAPANPAQVDANNVAAPAAGASAGGAAMATTGSTAMDGTAPAGGALPGMRANVGAPRDPTTGGAATGNGAPMASPGPSPSTAYPDHGTIAMTKDDLKAMPTFQFAK